MEINNLVFGGGGIKGIAFIGVLKKLEEKNVLKNIKRFAGTSIGSLIITMYLVGMTPDEIKDYIYRYDFKKFSEINILGLLSEYSVNNGNQLYDVMTGIFKKNKMDLYITLDDFFSVTGKEFTIITTSLTKQDVVYLSHKSWPNLPLFVALKMSMAVPIFYKPILYNEEYYVDGGLTNNFPMNVFNSHDTLGIRLDIFDNKIEINSFGEYLKAMFGCVAKMVDRTASNGKIVDLNIVHMGPLDFDIDLQTKKKLFVLGYDSLNEIIIA